jgi:hypothetical protein
MLRVGDVHQCEGVPYLRVEGEGDRVRYLQLHVLAQRLIAAYLGATRHAGDLQEPLFRSVDRHRECTDRPMHRNDGLEMIK